MANCYRTQLEDVRLEVKQETKTYKPRLNQPRTNTYRYFEVKFVGGPWQKVYTGPRYELGDKDSKRIKADFLGKCEHCGCQCLVSSFSGPSPYCSKSCSRAAHRALRPKPKVDHKNIRCGHCGHWFMPTRSTAKFCSAKCRVAANRTKAAKKKTTKKRRVRAK